MLFTSLIFLFLFLPCSLAAYYVCPRRYRNVILLSASLLFYAWGELEYVLVLLFSILLNYLFGMALDQFSYGSGRRLGVLTLAVLTNLAMLGFFKYSGFVVQNINAVNSVLGLPGISIAAVHLPLGISFFTFQALSYLGDVYRGTSNAQKNLGNLALYIALFPQVIAGPIVRYHEIARQLVSRRITGQSAAVGVRRFIVGLAKKVLIANSLAITADRIFAMESNNMGAYLAWLGVVCYALQIYFDFSGYSDMAVGLGALFGFRIPENFDHPYYAQSIREFWRRWHITLSNWFRDYLYIPLGGNRRGAIRTCINLILVFFLTGLWHGASWTFIIWGLVHGFFMILERLWLERWLQRQWRIVGHVYTLVVVCVAWVFFRSGSLPYAVEYVRTLVSFSPPDKSVSIGLVIGHQESLALVLGILFSFPVISVLSGRVKMVAGKLAAVPTLAEVLYPYASLVGYVALFALSVISIVSGSYNPFIYFNF